MSESQPTDFRPLQPRRMTLRGDEEVSSYLRIALPESESPVDQLIDRLCASDGRTWLTGRLDATFGESAGWFQTQLIEGQASLRQLEALKDSSKSLYHRATTVGTSLLALAGYFFAVAAALTHHGTFISGRSREEIRGNLLDLAEVMPAPWKEFLEGAVQAMDT